MHRDVNLVLERIKGRMGSAMQRDPKLEGMCENCGCEMTKAEVKAAGDGKMMCEKCCAEAVSEAKAKTPPSKAKQPPKMAKPSTFDSRKAMIYFDLSFEDYNLEDDQNSDEPSETFAAFNKLGKDDTARALAAEEAAMKEIGALMKKAGIDARLSNEGHSNAGSLIMKFGVNTPEEAKKVADFVKRQLGGGDDAITLDAPYMVAQGFRLYPQGVNKPSFQLVDTDEWMGEATEYTPEMMQALAGMAHVGGFAEAKPKSGERYKKLVGALKKKGAEDPKALAAWIGRKKYGKEQFQKLAAAGRKAKK